VRKKERGMREKKGGGGGHHIVNSAVPTTRFRRWPCGGNGGGKMKAFFGVGVGRNDDS
jgi:hypothetical protein